MSEIHVFDKELADALKEVGKRPEVIERRRKMNEAYDNMTEEEKMKSHQEMREKAKAIREAEAKSK